MEKENKICKLCKFYEEHDYYYGECSLLIKKTRMGVGGIKVKKEDLHSAEDSDETDEVNYYLKREGIDINIQASYSDKFFRDFVKKLNSFLKFFDSKVSYEDLHFDDENIEDKVSHFIEFRVHETFGCNQFLKKNKK